MYQLDYSGNGGELTVEAQRTKKRNNARFNIMDFLIILNTLTTPIPLTTLIIPIPLTTPTIPPTLIKFSSFILTS